MSDFGNGATISAFTSVTSPWPDNSPEDDVIFNDSSAAFEPSNSMGVSSIDEYMWIYFSPIVLILGLCGNILTIVVMRRKRLRGTTTSVYMPVMAVFDTVALCYGIAPEWFKATELVEFRELHPFLCKQEKFVFYTASDAAIWVLVLFTVDRFVAVSFPLQKSRVCVPRRSKIACAVAFALCVAKNLHVFWTRGAEYVQRGVLLTNCGKPEPYKTFESRHRPWMALALISVLPFCILLFCNCVIIWKLAKSSSRQQVEMRKSYSSQTTTTTTTKTTVERSKTFKQTTMMCLSASFVFLVCVIPSIVMLIGKPYWSDTDSYEVAKAVNNQLAYLNHSINFFLYCLTGQKFRYELVSLMVQVRRSIRHSDADGLSTSRNTVTSTPRSFKILNTVHSAPKGQVRVHACDL